MSIQIGGIDLADSVINTEFRLGVLERIVELLIQRNPMGGRITDADMKNIREQVISAMQKKYPQAGITIKNG